MRFTQYLLPILLGNSALCSPTATPTLDRRVAAMCGQWDSAVTGAYTVYQDLWNMGAATSGSQCTTVNSLSGTTLAWSTKWSWAGGAGQVKSYANAVVKQNIRRISDLKSIPTTWKWT